MVPDPDPTSLCVDDKPLDKLIGVPQSKSLQWSEVANGDSVVVVHIPVPHFEPASILYVQGISDCATSCATGEDIYGFLRYSGVDCGRVERLTGGCLVLEC